MNAVRTPLSLTTLVISLCLLLASVSLSQTPGTGAISGVVYDPSNRVVANAEVQATDEATRLSRSVRTTAEGQFRVSLLPPGTYDVTVKQPGFAENCPTPSGSQSARLFRSQ